MKTWQTIDKSKWEERGEWDNEPDKAQWIDKESGLDCLIVRGPSGALCGYVGIPETHKHFDKDYDSVDVDVHGGLTFADRCNPSTDESRGICHAGEIANKTVWWLGFDCAHAGDKCPSHSGLRYDNYDAYRSFNYVKNQIETLAEQLAA